MLLCALSAGSCLLADSDVPSPAGVPNFHVVAPGIYRGGAPTYAGLQSLQALGVRTIIDLRVEKKRAHTGQAARSLGFTWISLPMWDDPPKPQQVQTLLATLAAAPGRPVFVHCQHGCDRTGCMFGLYRVRVCGWTFEQAYAEMRRYGFDPRWTKLTEAVRQAAE
ncbi:MAG: tyrosine-protein phosphatase [Armatimonadetes bacterium]|nr:tyrosine-protein phosphatase [Armatimonadota bacterium]